MSDSRLASLERLSASLSQFPRAVPAAPLFPPAPQDRFVIKTLDAEMARLEQAITRSGWTTWAGTAALGALAWAFIALLDGAAGFSWLRLAQLVTLLSLVQDFVYSIDYNLRPRRGFGLLAGSQLRVMRTTEALPFARPQFLFYFVRASLGAAATYLLLPELVGGWWVAPFIIYILVAVTMCLSFGMSTISVALPKHEEPSVGELVGSGLALGVAWLGIDALIGTWQAGDLLAFKAAIVVIAAVHVIRGLAAPQYEIPALDQLQDIRRKLGFGQLSALEAVARAEAALVGHMALTFLMNPLAALQAPVEKLEAEAKALGEDIARIERQALALARQDAVGKDQLRMQESLVSQALRRGTYLLQPVPSIVDARQKLASEIERYKKGTKDDQSVPLAEAAEKRLTATCAATLLQLLPRIARLKLSMDAIGELATRRQLPLDTTLRPAFEKLQQDALARLKDFQLSLPKDAAAGKD